MYDGEKLDLYNEIFKPLRQEIEVSLNAALMLADKDGKEGEITVKIKVRTQTEHEFKEGRVCREWTEPRFDWSVARKMKENKIDHKGSSLPGWELKFDEDGRPYIKEANKQGSMFEEPEAKTVIHYHFGESKKDPEVNKNETAGEESESDGEIGEPEFDSSMDEDGGRTSDGEESEGFEDSVPEEADSKG